MTLSLRMLPLIGLLLCGSATWSTAATVAAASDLLIQPVPKVVRLWGDVEYQHEYQAALTALGWQTEAIQVKGAIDLAARLETSKIDLVVVGTLVNNTDKVDFQPDVPRWKGWIGKGGGLFVSDCSSIWLINRWINAFGTDIVNPEGTSTLWRENDQSRPLALGDECDQQLTMVPNVLTTTLGMKPGSNPWSAFSEVPTGWSSAMTDPEGKKLFINRSMDNGAFILTKFYGFLGAESRDAGRAMLENVWCLTLCTRHGIVLQRKPSAPSSDVVELSISNSGKKSFQAVVAGSPGKTVDPSTTVVLKIPVKVGLTAPLKIVRAGQDLITLQMRQGSP